MYNINSRRLHINYQWNPTKRRWWDFFFNMHGHMYIKVFQHMWTCNNSRKLQECIITRKMDILILSNSCSVLVKSLHTHMCVHVHAQTLLHAHGYAPKRADVETCILPQCAYILTWLFCISGFLDFAFLVFFQCATRKWWPCHQ